LRFGGYIGRQTAGPVAFCGFLRERNRDFFQPFSPTAKTDALASSACERGVKDVQKKNIGKQIAIGRRNECVR
jgi:hypothetical protein